MTIVCADTIREAKAVAQMGPDMMVVEPVELIGTGEACGLSYVKASVEAVRSVDPRIGILVGGGISSGEDVYQVIWRARTPPDLPAALPKPETPAPW